MNAHCRDFRLLLETCLAGRTTTERLAELSWHQHLFGCAECRALLEAEEALESLLASLPEPRLAPEVRERVLARLRSTRIHEQREERLDRLLDAAAAEAPPPDLARQVLAGLADRAGVRGRDALDRLLALDVVEAPRGLPERTLAALELARRAPRREVTVWRVVAFAAAAAALTALVWMAMPERPKASGGRGQVVQEPKPATNGGPAVPGTDGGARREGARVATNGGAVTDDVLAALDVLEYWDVLVADDGETLLTVLPTADEALLDEFGEEG